MPEKQLVDFTPLTGAGGEDDECSDSWGQSGRQRNRRKRLSGSRSGTSQPRKQRSSGKRSPSPGAASPDVEDGNGEPRLVDSSSGCDSIIKLPSLPASQKAKRSPTSPGGVNPLNTSAGALLSPKEKPPSALSQSGAPSQALSLSGAQGLNASATSGKMTSGGGTSNPGTAAMGASTCSNEHLDGTQSKELKSKNAAAA
eukprot:Hpha_TRINITY_DN4135_c0_g2::TRINITY_DN4135_c0_g2_i1::g.194819::m.194819